MVAPVPPDMRRRYLLRSKTARAGRCGSCPSCARMVRFARLNLMDATYPVDRDMDVIFCRNILIYFDKPTQEAVLARLATICGRAAICSSAIPESPAGFGLPLDRSARPRSSGR